VQVQVDGGAGIGVQIVIRTTSTVIRTAEHVVEVEHEPRMKNRRGELGTTPATTLREVRLDLASSRSACRTEIPVGGRECFLLACGERHAPRER